VVLGYLSHWRVNELELAPNNSFKRTAVTVCATIQAVAAAVA